MMLMQSLSFSMAAKLIEKMIITDETPVQIHLLREDDPVEKIVIRAKVNFLRMVCTTSPAKTHYQPSKNQQVISIAEWQIAKYLPLGVCTGHFMSLQTSSSAL